MAMGAKVVGGSMVDSMVSVVDSMVDRCMVDSMVGWGMVDSMVSITKIDVRVGSSSVDSVVDRCSMVDRVVDSMVDSWVGRSMQSASGKAEVIEACVRGLGPKTTTGR